VKNVTNLLVGIIIAASFAFGFWWFGYLEGHKDGERLGKEFLLMEVAKERANK
jgi:uncharacterized RDD family membrane protein YckC